MANRFSVWGCTFVGALIIPRARGKIVIPRSRDKIVIPRARGKLVGTKQSLPHLPIINLSSHSVTTSYLHACVLQYIQWVILEIKGGQRDEKVKKFENL